MKYIEMSEIFKNNGVDIEKQGYTYGLKLHSGPCSGYILNKNTNKYERIIIGDRDNGRTDKIYETEDEAVLDMIYDIRREAVRKKAKYQKHPDNSQLNNKILDIALYIEVQITGYKGYKIWMEFDHDTWQEWYVATYWTPKGTDCTKTIESGMWAQDSINVDEYRRAALDDIKRKIDDLTNKDKRVEK